MDSSIRKLVRQIIRRVHPDLYSAHPPALRANQEALRALNAYLDGLSSDGAVRGSTVEFFVKDGTSLVQIRAELPASGSLGPLLHAFGAFQADCVERCRGLRPGRLILGSNGMKCHTESIR